MSEKKLVIVESPTKAKTISKILGDEYAVTPSMGHLIDLPERKLGVDIEHDFEPSYTVLRGRSKVITLLKKLAKSAESVYIATDPDREGEAIGWQIKENILKNKKVFRVDFHEITREAVRQAFAGPRDFDRAMIEAQTSRRILDRIVGYFLSPLLWKKIARGLSAGRVQSVALRLIAERERQIRNFVPQEYWEIEAEFVRNGAVFSAQLEKKDGVKVEIKNGQESEGLCADIRTRQFAVSEIKKTQKYRNPDAPFITSTLQQEGFNKLKFNAAKTMLIAQQLYEGIDIGEDAPVGLITYMRTDSTNIAAEAIKQVRQLIKEKYGDAYVPEKPPVYKSKKFAQAAHEAIRPTLINRTPQSLERYLNPDQYRLYELIYNRFLASQMSAARYALTRVEITGGPYLFAASGSQLIFDGFGILYPKEQEPEKKNIIPDLAAQDALALQDVSGSQHFTKPPPRFSDSSLIKMLEEEGIGRPSTYAPIISTLVLRGYVHRMKGYLHPTELGFLVCDMLIDYFPEVMDIKFTANMEEELDQVEEGKIGRLKVLNDFYRPFKTSFDFAQQNIKKEVIESGDVCEKCGKPMIIKWGRRGKFLSCSGFPECKHSKSITTGVKCPQPGCTGELMERRSKRGMFYGCSTYPKCTYIAKTLPGAQEE